MFDSGVAVECCRQGRVDDEIHFFSLRRLRRHRHTIVLVKHLTSCPAKCDEVMVGGWWRWPIFAIILRRSHVVHSVQRLAVELKHLCSALARPHTQKPGFRLNWEINHLVASAQKNLTLEMCK